MFSKQHVLWTLQYMSIDRGLIFISFTVQIYSQWAYCICILRHLPLIVIKFQIITNLWKNYKQLRVFHFWNYSFFQLQILSWTPFKIMQKLNLRENICSIDQLITSTSAAATAAAIAVVIFIVFCSVKEKSARPTNLSQIIQPKILQ